MHSPLPPPPDGQAPIRLPIGEEPFDAEPNADEDDPLTALKKKFAQGMQ